VALLPALAGQPRTGSRRLAPPRPTGSTQVHRTRSRARNRVGAPLCGTHAELRARSCGIERGSKPSVVGNPLYRGDRCGLLRRCVERKKAGFLEGASAPGQHFSPSIPRVPGGSCEILPYVQPKDSERCIFVDSQRLRILDMDVCVEYLCAKLPCPPFFAALHSTRNPDATILRARATRLKCVAVITPQDSLDRSGRQCRLTSRGSRPSDFEVDEPDQERRLRDAGRRNEPKGRSRQLGCIQPRRHECGRRLLRRGHTQSWPPGRSGRSARCSQGHPDDVHFACLESVAEGEWVSVRGMFSGTHRGIGRIPVNGGMLVEVQPTGRHFEVQHIHLFQVHGGKVVEHFANRDDLGMMQPLGVLPIQLPPASR